MDRRSEVMTINICATRSNVFILYMLICIPHGGYKATHSHWSPFFFFMLVHQAGDHPSWVHFTVSISPLFSSVVPPCGRKTWVIANWMSQQHHSRRSGIYYLTPNRDMQSNQHATGIWDVPSHWAGREEKIVYRGTRTWFAIKVAVLWWRLI